jgi:hypothetical protein
MGLSRASSRAAIALGAMVAMLAGAAGTATAAEASSAIHSSIATQATVVPAEMTTEMTLDCVDMTPKARQYALSHGYCPKTVASGSVEPYNTVSGNCGSSWIYIYPWGYAGEANVKYGFSSSKGTVVHRYLNGYWDSSNGLDGAWTDSGFMASSSYSKTRTINAGRGWMYASLSGYVTLWWGGTCYLLVPSDERYVS